MSGVLVGGGGGGHVPAHPGQLHSVLILISSISFLMRRLVMNRWPNRATKGVRTHVTPSLNGNVTLCASRTVPHCAIEGGIAINLLMKIATGYPVVTAAYQPAILSADIAVCVPNAHLINEQTTTIPQIPSIFLEEFHRFLGRIVLEQ